MEPRAINDPDFDARSYETGYRDGGYNGYADWIGALRDIDLPFEFDGPFDFADKLEAYLEAATVTPG